MLNISNSGEERISDKAFLRGLVVSVLSILLCMASLSWMTYAWYSFSTAKVDFPHTFAPEITVTALGDNDAVGKTITVTEVTGQEGLYTCVLPTAGRYTVTLILADGSAAKGYCAVTLKGRRLCTDAIIGEETLRGDAFAVNAPFTFTVETSADRTTLLLQSHMGVPADPHVHAGDTLSADNH